MLNKLQLTIGNNPNIYVVNETVYIEPYVYRIDIKVNNSDMYDALELLLPDEYVIGATFIKINLTGPVNDGMCVNDKVDYTVEMLEHILTNNTRFSRIIVEREMIYMIPYNIFVLFKPEVIAFNNDDIFHYYLESSYVTGQLFGNIMLSFPYDIPHDVDDDGDDVGISYCLDMALTDTITTLFI